MKKIYLLIVLLLQFCNSYSQDGFKFVTNKNKIVIPYKMSNNLVVAPLKINGINLNFLIDTGVENTILFSLEDTEAIDLKNVEKIKIKGLGSGEAIDAFKSNNNTIALKDYIDTNHEIYIILDQDINFSAQLGIPVHGILGYHFFKNHLVEINSISKKIVVYKDAKVFNKKKLKGYGELPISIELEKPYVKAKVKINDKVTDVKLLVDTGGSDALWLFENEKTIKCPNNFFNDFLGKGFSGDIFGKRSRLEKIYISDFEIENPTVSFPDELSIKSVDMVEGRNGSIGSGIMRRFNVVYDYSNSKIYLKTNRNFEEPFNYNMSGIEVQHNGKEIIQEISNDDILKANFIQRDFKGSMNVDFEKTHDIKYQFYLRPIYEISLVRPDSPAQKAGLMKGDILKKINGKLTYKVNLSDITELLQSEEGKWISLEIMRNNVLIKTKFQLKKIL